MQMGLIARIKSLAAMSRSMMSHALLVHPSTLVSAPNVTHLAVRFGEDELGKEDLDRVLRAVSTRSITAKRRAELAAEPGEGGSARGNKVHALQEIENGKAGQGGKERISSEGNESSELTSCEDEVRGCVSQSHTKCA